MLLGQESVLPNSGWEVWHLPEDLKISLNLQERGRQAVSVVGEEVWWELFPGLAAWARDLGAFQDS